MSDTSQPPPGVPSGARWDSRLALWESGPIDLLQGRHGTFRYWRDDGTLLAVYTYRQGMLNGPYTRFHDDGSPAETGLFKDGRPDGVVTTYRGPEGSREGVPFPPYVVASVVRCESERIGGLVVAQRWFDAAGRRMRPDGRPWTRGAARRPDDLRFVAPRRVRDLEGYVRYRFAHDLQAFFPDAPRLPALRDRRGPPAAQVLRLGVANRRAIEHFDALVHRGDIPHLRGFDVQNYGLAATPASDRFLVLCASESADRYVLDLRLGRVFPCRPPDGRVAESQYFANLDTFCWIQLRLAAARDGKIPFAELTDPLFALGQPGGFPELQLALLGAAWPSTRRSKTNS